MKNFSIVIMSLVLLVSGTFSSPSLAAKWQLQKKQNGVKVYTRSIAGSKFKEFKGVVTVRASMDSLLAVMSDVKATCNWLHQCGRSQLLAKLSPFERYTYQINDFPWPATDRDIILHSMVSYKNNNKRITIRLNAAPTYCEYSHIAACRSKKHKVTRKKYVRVTRSSGFYRFSQNRNNTITIVWQMHYEPGGDLPGWIANGSLVDTPLKSLQNLKKIVRQRKYRHAKFKYNAKGEVVDFIKKPW